MIGSASEIPVLVDGYASVVVLSLGKGTESESESKQRWD